MVLVSIEIGFLMRELDFSCENWISHARIEFLMREELDFSCIYL